MNALTRTVLDLLAGDVSAATEVPTLPGEVPAQDARHLVLVLGHDTVEIATELGQRLVDATVHLLVVSAADPALDAELPANVRVTLCRSIWDRVDHLAGLPRPQLIVESGNGRKGQKLACFRELFLFLEPGGCYVVDRLADVDDEALHDVPGETVLDLLERLEQARSLDPEDASLSKPDAELVRASCPRRICGDRAYVSKQHRHLMKLRDERAADLLTARLGDSWGSVVEIRSGYTYPSRARVSTYGDGPLHGSDDVPRPISVPQRSLRRYEKPVVLPRQRVLLGDFFLPETFRHHLARRLAHHTMVGATAALDRLKEDWELDPTDLPGSFFHFDTEYPGHYGHVMTEVISRYHGWTEARRLEPGVRPLVSLREGEQAMPDYQVQLFDALGIPSEEVVYVPHDRTVRPELLYGVTPDFTMPHYADLGLAALYAEVARRLHTPHLETPEKLFVSRRPGGWRHCHNLSDVEEWFTREGFTVVYPEDHSLGDQISMFRQARRLAGFGGSGMFSLMFAPGARCVLLSGNANTANNEYLIGSVVGLDLHYFWSPSDIQHPESGWTDEAFHSGFTFELDRFAGQLRRLLAD